MVTGTSRETAVWRWDLAVAAGCLTTAVVVLLSGPNPGLALAGVCAVAVVYAVLARPGLRAPGSWVAWLAVVLLSAAMGAACAGSPPAAVLQLAVYPLLWSLMLGRARGIAASALLAVGILAGTRISSTWGSAIATAVFSLVISIMVGLWISAAEIRAAERDQLLIRLRESQDEVVALERVAARDAERLRVSRDIHDTIAQSLTGLVMTAQRARREAGDDHDRTAQTLEVIEHLATEALQEARALMSGYADVSTGLTTVIERVGAAFQRETGVEVHVEADLVSALPREDEVVLLRCVQESLANVRKHARASRVDIVAAREPGRVVLTVSDDGVGLGAAPSPLPGEGHGIRGMKDRVDLAGGGASVEARDPRGTRVRVWLPREEE